jgi:hypothetical protein
MVAVAFPCRVPQHGVIKPFDSTRLFDLLDIAAGRLDIPIVHTTGIKAPYCYTFHKGQQHKCTLYTRVTRLRWETNSSPASVAVK